MNQIINGNMPI